MNIKLFTTILLISLAAIFVVQNVAVLEFRFLFWKFEISRALMFIFLVLSRVIIGWFQRGHMLH